MASNCSLYLLAAASLGSLNAVAQFGAAQLVHDLPFAGQLKAMDLDGDGDQDLVGLFNGNHVKWMENTDGQGAFAEEVEFANTGLDYQRFLGEDLDNDGLTDILLVRDDVLAWVRNLGGGVGDDVEGIAQLDEFTGAVACSDVSGDGLVDILYLAPTELGAGLGVLVNNGNGFSAPTFLPDPVDGLATTMLLVADMDLVGGLDVVVSTTFGDLMILRNTSGDGSLWSPTVLLAGSPYAYFAPEALDVDGDGDLDLVEAGGGAVHWAENNVGEGGAWDVFTEHVLEAVWTAGQGRFGNMGCDGVSLVYVPSNPSLPVRWSSWLSNLQDFGYRQDRPDIARGMNPLLADLNGDGKDDLVIVRPEGTFWQPSEAVPATTVLVLPTFEPLCLFGPPVDLPPAEPTGGRWSGTWVDADIYYRSNIGVSGEQTLAHTYYEPTSCPVAEIAAVDLLQGPVPSPAVPNILCTAQPPVVMTSYPASSTWFGLAEGNILDPAQFTGGMIACEMTDATNITCATLIGPIEVWNSLPAEITAAGPFCVDAGPQSITALAAPPQGAMWSGAIVDQSPFQALFDPAVGPGTYEVIMTVTPVGPNQCANSDTLVIEVTNDHPEVILPEVTAFCQSGDPYPVVVTPADGVWSGTGIVNGELVPALLSPGSNSLTYTAISASGCATIATYSVEIYDAIAVDWEMEDLVFCKTDPSAFLNASPTGGLWSAPVWTDGEFVPGTVPPGTYPVTYTWQGPNNCEIVSEVIELNVLDDTPVELDPIWSACVEATEAQITGSHYGIWSVSIVGEGSTVVYSPNALGVGSWPVTLTATEEGFCPGTANALILVEICSEVSELANSATTLAPNPFQDRLTLQFGSVTALRIEVLDATGRSVRQLQPTSDHAILDLSGEANGTYVIRVFHANSMETFRAVKAD